MFKKFVRWLLGRLYRVTLRGFENYAQAGKRVLIVANHTSYLDPVLLWAFLPDEVTFAINTRIAGLWWVRPGLLFSGVFPMDPLQPMSIKALTHYLKEDRKAVIFPEGRITVTGSLMKIYDGAALVADKSGATVLPVRVDGAQYTPFSYLHGVVRLRWFPPITLTILPPRTLPKPEGVGGHERRHRLGRALADVMSEMMFASGNYRQTLFSALLDARRVHGGRHELLEDAERKPLDYQHLIARILALGRVLAGHSREGETVGILLPNVNATVAALFGLQVHGRVPALLNYSAGSRALLSCCRTAGIRTVLSSRRFVGTARLEASVAQLAETVRVLYLEDLTAGLGRMEKLRAMLGAWTADGWYRSGAQAWERPAVILFTSGSEGEPKGVVLTHANLLTNLAQLAARLDFNAQDTLLNVLPLFHAFGLTAGTLLPLFSGMRAFLYPSPLHYRIIPEIAYEINATLLFATNTFLAAYARHAHPYDFYRLRYVFAGAEKLQADTRRVWMEKFGIRVLEGYGATEAAPVLTANTPMAYREGTVGRFLPGIEWQLEEIPGVAEGGRLHVAGSNIMAGYLRPERPGELQPALSVYGDGWYDTGDVVRVDAEGYVTILGRAKRFAKIGGEMVSLATVEDLAVEIWPGHHHAAISLPDERKGEKILLVTDCRQADRPGFARAAQARGYGELYLPREVRVMKELPLLATGKVDYPALAGLIAARAGE